jgi:predicted nuclease with RNAse H fold
MENLTKLETAAALAAVRAVLIDAPSLPDENPLRTAEAKLDANLKEFSA